MKTIVVYNLLIPTSQKNKRLNCCDALSIRKTLLKGVAACKNQ